MFVVWIVLPSRTRWSICSVQWMVLFRLIILIYKFKKSPPVWSPLHLGCHSGRTGYSEDEKLHSCLVPNKQGHIATGVNICPGSLHDIPEFEYLVHAHILECAINSLQIFSLHFKSPPLYSCRFEDTLSTCSGKQPMFTFSSIVFPATCFICIQQFKTANMPSTR